MGDTIEVDLQRLGLSPDGARWRLAHDLRKGEKAVARIVLLGGWLDLEKRRLTPAPPEMADVFERLDAGEPYQDLPPLKREGERGLTGLAVPGSRGEERRLRGAGSRQPE
jgi:acyl-CoA thioester hydrolase